MVLLNQNLKAFNTFGIEVNSRKFAAFNSGEELARILESEKNENIFVLGGGSNILLTKDFDGLVIKNEILGIDTLFEDENSIHLKVGAGVVWHDFVLHCVENNFGGIENLSLIPGSVGASPMQNIGAYGVEIKDVFVELEAYRMDSGEIHVFSNKACEFAYRDSIFKRKQKGQFIILSSTFRLTKKDHLVQTSYGDIEKELSYLGIEKPTIKNISDVVIKIRNSKLPDPKEIGNAGSFFKNPVVGRKDLDLILEKYPTAPNYPLSEDKFKLAAGWLIDTAGWKGKKLGNYGVHEKQALVLVNYGGCTGEDIYKLSQMILDDIKNKFGITLEREVNIY